MQIPEFLLVRRNQIIIAICIVIIIVVVIILNRPKEQLVVPASEVTLTWWNPFYGNDVYADIIADFKKIPGNNGITFNPVTKDYGPEYYRTLIADIAKNAGPDIFSIRNDDLPAYKEYMTPITQFKGDVLNAYKRDFVDLVVRDTIDRENVYAIASYVENMQLYYNKNILAQSGIALPPKTWTELDRQLAQINKRNSSSLNFDQSAISLGTGGRGLEGPPNINRLEDIMPLLLFQNSGQLYEYKTNRSVFGMSKNQRDVDTGLASGTNFKLDEKDKENNPTYRSIKFYTDFANDGTSRYSWNTASNNNLDAFVDGKLAYMLHYSYQADAIRGRNDRLPFDVAPLPQLDPSLKRTYGFFFMDGMNRALEKDPKQLAKKQAASRFLFYLSTKEAQEKFNAKTRTPAARKDVITKQQSADDQIRIFAEGALYADNYYKPDVEAAEKIWRDLVERVQYKNQPLTESINQAVREYNVLVQNGPKLRK
jgi:ABC-type glycerol-3-phosphate transport system substrate-binding protein